MTDIAIVTHSDAPSGVADDQILADALRRIGARPAFAAWDDSAVDWTRFQVAIIRSAWNYHLRPTAWKAWVGKVSRLTRLVNPAPLVLWNSDKNYLLHLAGAGVPVVPSIAVARGGVADIESIGRDTGWTDIIVKPTFGASAHGVLRFDGDPAAARRHAERLLADTGILIQPYLPEVGTARERSLVIVAGTFCHAFTKSAFMSGLDAAAGELTRHEPTSDELCAAALALAAAPWPPLYARVDLVPTALGPVVMELELIEPQLAFGFCLETADRLAAALVAGVAAPTAYGARPS